MKIAVVTANTGGIDTTKILPPQSVECDYFEFTDANMPFPMASLDNRMKAKYFKLQTHKVLPGYDHYIWVDSSFKVISQGFVALMLSRCQGFDMTMTKHPDRDCIYKEAAFVEESMSAGNKYLLGRYQNSKISEQADYYKRTGHPANHGLYACGLFARPNNDKMNDFFNKWWDSCLQWSAFDQISFSVLARDFEIKINPLTFETFTNNEFFQIVPHKKII